MSRLLIRTPSQTQAVVDNLYGNMERRIAASPPGLCPVDMIAERTSVFRMRGRAVSWTWSGRVPYARWDIWVYGYGRVPYAWILALCRLCIWLRESFHMHGRWMFHSTLCYCRYA